MTFLHSSMLWWLLILPVMILLVLVSRRRRRVSVGSVMLFRVLQEGQPSSVHRYRSVSMAQALCLAIFVMAAVLQAAGWSWLSQHQDTIGWHVYVDDSILMNAIASNGEPLYDQVLKPLSVWAGALPANEIVEVHFLSGADAIRVDVESLKDTSTCRSLLFNTLKSIFTPAWDRLPEVSDSVYVGSAAHRGNRFQYVFVPGEVQNFAVTAFDVWEQEGKTHVFASLVNVGSGESVDWTLTADPSGQTLASGTVVFDSRFHVDVTASISDPGESLLFSLFSLLSEDGFAADNYAVARQRRQQRAGLQFGVEHSHHEPLFRRAVKAAGWELSSDQSTLDRMFCWGGGIPDHDIPTWLVKPDNVSGIKVLSDTVTASLMYAPDVPEFWKRLHLDALIAVTLQRVTYSSKWSPVLLSTKGDPAMLTDGRHLIWLFDPETSGWASEASFPLSILQFLQEGTASREWQVQRCTEISDLVWDEESSHLQSQDGEVVSLLAPALSYFSQVSQLQFPKSGMLSQEKGFSKAQGSTNKTIPMAWLAVLALLVNGFVFSRR